MWRVRDTQVAAVTISPALIGPSDTDLVELIASRQRVPLRLLAAAIFAGSDEEPGFGGTRGRQMSTLPTTVRGNAQNLSTDLSQADVTANCALGAALAAGQGQIQQWTKLRARRLRRIRQQYSMPN
jgi:hypothetical protein